jgi:glycosyltransferase involved in cell wall biosynthesis
MPLVSVIIPMYNAEPFISATLVSILQEQQISLEVIVINDQSTDASLEKVLSIRDERIKVIEGKKEGIAAALNLGIAEAQGEIFMRCDADDLYPPGRIKEQINWLSQHPEFGAVCGGFSTIDQQRRTVANLVSRCQDNEEITVELRQGKTRTHFCTYATRAELLRKLDGFRSYFETAEDIDLQLRLGEQCRVMYIPEVQYYYRLHDTSITHSVDGIRREFFDQIARTFQQQRAIKGFDDLEQGCSPSPPRSFRKKTNRASEHIQGMLLGSAWREHQGGRKQQAVLLGVKSVVAQPKNFRVWRSLLALIVKPSIRNQKE